MSSGRPDCIIANRCNVQCKEKPSVVNNKNPYPRCIITLTNSAKCIITKECDDEDVKNKYSRAFSVIVKEQKSLGELMGSLICDFCKKLETKKYLKNKHLPIHKMLHEVKRIKQHPIVCIRNDEISNKEYATINISYSPK